MIFSPTFKKAEFFYFWCYPHCFEGRLLRIASGLLQGQRLKVAFVLSTVVSHNHRMGLKYCFSYIIVIIFVVCNSFESILFILHSQEILRRDVVQDYLRSIGDVLMVFNSSVNAIIYGAVSSQFRATFLQICCCKGEEKKRHISKTDSSNVVIPSSKLPRNMNLKLTSQHSIITTRSLSPVSTPA